MGTLHRSPARRQMPTILITSPIMGLPLVNNNGRNHIPIHSKVNLGNINNLGTAHNPAMAIIRGDSTGLA
ncbi:hypothetical protein FRC11_013684 [Ceratobasidium sp. 423]|nr:hypothetical protein FRC11_013684 [Ceratobasidium sp. 423]